MIADVMTYTDGRMHWQPEIITVPCWEGTYQEWLGAWFST